MSITGRIIRGVGGQYWIAMDDGQIGIASVRGIFRKEKALIPTAGDRVVCEPSGDPGNPWRIVEILPRRNFLVRPTLANLDGLVITISAADPPPDFYLVDKLLTICRLNDVEPLLCLTKTDLEAPSLQLDCYRSAGCRIIETQPDDLASLEALKAWFAGRVISFAGQSGVGKSTLLNRLFGEQMMPAGELSIKAGRGRHTTRHVELFPLAGGYLADTPGFSTLELHELGVTGEQLVAGYPEIVAVEAQCRFTGCRHLGDLGCAVPDSGIDPERLLRYRFFRTQLDSIKPYAAHQPRGR